MARQKIREYDAKTMLADYCQKYAPSLFLKPRMALLTPETKVDALPAQYPWLEQESLVIKPDQLFGKRGKLNLVLLNASFAHVLTYLQQYRNKEITIGNAKDQLTHFLIEPYIPHDHEYYLAFTSQRGQDLIYFSSRGGIQVEEHWDQVITIPVPTLTPITDINCDILLPPLPHKERVIQFIQTMFNAFRALDFTYLEFNPFTINDNENSISLLDTVAQVDDCAGFLHSHEWKNLPFPKPFGKQSFPEEEFIESLDKDSGASLKLTILNPKGRIWNILSGGGASIIYLDAIAGFGKQEEIANYGEYSGNPTTQESYLYARTILDLMTRESNQKEKILIIGGAIANFTDVEKTFSGIIAALKEYQEQLQNGKVSIFVRRGGPNYEKGLKLIEQAGKNLHLPMYIEGPDSPMVHIVRSALGGLS